MLFKKKNVILQTFASGNYIPITQVPDQIFSEKMMGDGAAILVEDEYICAPANATVTMIAETKHAIGLTLSNGAEILLHVGLDTVQLQGEGFEVLVSEHEKVKASTALLRLDLSFMKEKGVTLYTPLVVLNHEEHPITFIHEREHVSVGEDWIQLN